MKHVTDHELSAHLDGALDASERERVAAHLEGCETCRASLERLAAQDRGLASALAMDPGEDYFETFAARVENRIRAQGLGGAQTHAERFEGAWRWLRSPRALAWAGGVAALVIGSGVVLMTGRDVQMPNLHQPKWTERVSRSSAPAPGTGTAPPAAPEASRSSGAESQTRAAAPRDASLRGNETATGRGMTEGQVAPRADADRLNDQVATRQKLEARAGRAYEVKRNSLGDDVPVATRPLPGGTRVESQPPPATGSGPVYAKSLRRAEPMSGGAVAQKAAPAPPTQNVAPAPQAATAPSTPSSSPDLARAPLDEKSAAGATGDRLAAREGGARSAAEARAAESASRRCGLIRDPAGRPVANAQVIVPETGASVTTAADGSFCIDTPSEARTLITMAVGFETESRMIPADQAPISVTMHAVSVVGGAMAVKPQASPGAPTYNFISPPRGGGSSGALKTDGAPREEARDPLSGLPQNVRVAIDNARNLEIDAARRKSANQYEAAAREWQQALQLTGDAAAANELRFRIAAARHNAWQLDPTRERMIDAMSAASSFLLRAPPGTEREQAAGWLQGLRWGTNRALYR